MIPTQGIICKGQEITLGWPDKSDFDKITALRNDPGVRCHFLDSRIIDPQENRTWLTSGMNRPSESLLSIRWLPTGAFVGTIGWSGWDRARATACFGRLMVDRIAIRQIRGDFDKSYPGVAIDAATTLRDFAFTGMELRELTTYHLADNERSNRVNLAVGMRQRGTEIRLKADGSSVQTIEFHLTRDEWELIARV